MKKILLTFTLVLLASQPSMPQNTADSTEMRFEAIEKKISEAERAITGLRKESKVAHDVMSGQIEALQAEDVGLRHSIDSLSRRHDTLAWQREADNDTISKELRYANSAISHNQSTLQSRTWWGIGITAFIAVVIGIIARWLSRRIKSGTSSIDEVRKAQDALQVAQAKMQEESIKLDNKLIEIAEQQMKASVPTSGQGSTAIDHSLALKVADEIVRIELNLSRMDSSVKGYKQLAKAVQRIKDNFQANGYEIVDMLGKPYNEGMRINANFVLDESLPMGTQKITSITKPQVNYNGEMIQKAQVIVSQNI